MLPVGIKAGIGSGTRAPRALPGLAVTMIMVAPTPSAAISFFECIYSPFGRDVLTEAHVTRADDSSRFLALRPHGLLVDTGESPPRIAIPH